ncbi:MAG: MFS transporter [Pseudomonadota bacterium]|nr:MFS transporter [Pseudomonadota bacterium]
MNSPVASALPTHSMVSLSRGLLFVFALPGILQAFMLAPSASILQGVYAKESGITLVALGSAVLVVRLFDLVSDLLIGFLSDRSAQRGVSRKLWIAAGTVVTAIGLWFLFRPPPQVTVGYYGFWFLIANIGWSLVEIPYRSWSIEFSPEPNERTRIVTWIAVASLLGGLMFYAVAPAGKALGLLASAEINLQTLGLTAVIVTLLLPFLTLYTLIRVPDTKSVQVPVPVADIPKESFALLWKSVIGNAPLMRLLFCLSIYYFMTGMSQGVSLLYLTNYLGLSSSVNVVFALAVPLSMLGIPLWGLLITKFDRQRVWAGAMAVAGMFYGSMGLLPPQPSVLLLGVLFGTATFFSLSAVVAAPVIMGDIIDHGRHKFGVERAGLYLSLKAQIVKGAGAVAAGAGLIFLGWMGFDASKSGADLTPQAVSALKWVVSWGPLLGMMGTAVLLWFMPISRAGDTRAVEARGDATGFAAD